jgi:signal transduction histidine kinase
VDINDVVRSSVDLLGAQMRAHGVELQCELASDLPSISANPFSLEEVLVNLVNNARHSIEAKRHRDETQVGGAVRICTRLELDPAGARIEVVVSDDGVGIPEQVLERAFDPFYTTKPPDEGTGLAAR